MCLNVFNQLDWASVSDAKPVHSYGNNKVSFDRLSFGANVGTRAHDDEALEWAEMSDSSNLRVACRAIRSKPNVLSCTNIYRQHLASLKAILLTFKWVSKKFPLNVLCLNTSWWCHTFPVYSWFRVIIISLISLQRRFAATPLSFQQEWIANGLGFKSIRPLNINRIKSDSKAQPSKRQFTVFSVSEAVN